MRRLTLLALFALTLGAHPMGNFSVNRYARIDLNPQAGSALTYVLDFAEIPTFELFQQWKIDAPSPAQLQAIAQAQAATWLAELALTQNGAPVSPHLKHVKSQITDGAGGMPVLRVELLAALPLAPGQLHYQDKNYPGRAGWKEVVIRRANGVAITQATHSGRDLSQALTAYPTDLTLAPPQDLEAQVTWTAAPAIATEKPTPAKPIETTQPPAVFTAPQAPAAGTVVKGDYLSRLLKHQDLTLAMILLGLAAAFGLGAMHALSPGHGKTIVAAYLVGSRGTLKHALFLGGMVTFTHTLSVFLLGLGVLFFQQYIVPEQIIPLLGAISGLSIVLIGAYLLYQRTMNLSGHHVHYVPEPESVPEPELVAVSGQPSFLTRVDHQHPGGFVHSHTHNGSTHSHDLPEEITLKSLTVLGASGGLVPCPSALVLMLSAIALGRTALGLALLVSFSAGLAMVLMAIGGLVIYAKHLLPERTAQNPFFRLVPIFSAVVVMILGVLMTLTSLGYVKTPLT